MTINLHEALIPLAPLSPAAPVDASAYPDGEHPRFISLRAYASGLHPVVTVGQVWESLERGDRDEHGPRQVAVINVSDDSWITVVTVNFDGGGMQSNLGIVSRMPIYRMQPRFDGSSGWRLIGMSIPVDATGRVLPGFPIPEPASPSDFVGKSSFGFEDYDAYRSAQNGSKSGKGSSSTRAAVLADPKPSKPATEVVKVKKKERKEQKEQAKSQGSEDKSPPKPTAVGSAVPATSTSSTSPFH